MPVYEVPSSWLPLALREVPDGPTIGRARHRYDDWLRRVKIARDQREMLLGILNAMKEALDVRFESNVFTMRSREKTHEQGSQNGRCREIRPMGDC